MRKIILFILKRVFYKPNHPMLGLTKFNPTYIYILLMFLLLFGASITQADEIAAGKTKSMACVACHGEDGNSAANPIWPKLAQQNAKYLTKELLDFKLGAKGGRNNPVMTGLAAPLNDQDILEISEYYASLPRTIGAAQPSLVVRGQLLYRGGDLQKGIPACMACHSPDGAGNSLAPFPVLSGQHADYTVAQLKAFRDGTRSNDLNAMMRAIAAKMSDQDIIAVASYIEGLH